MRLLNDIYKNNFGSLEVETEKDSVLNSNTKFGITYSLYWEDDVPDEIAESIEKQDHLLDVLRYLTYVEMIEMSFKSFSLGFIEEDEECYNLTLTIDSFMNLHQDYEDIMDVGREYNEVFPEIMEMLGKYL